MIPTKRQENKACGAVSYLASDLNKKAPKQVKSVRGLKKKVSFSLPGQ